MWGQGIEDHRMHYTFFSVSRIPLIIIILLFMDIEEKRVNVGALLLLLH